MWDLSGPGIELVSPALAGGFLTTGLPGKPLHHSLKIAWSTMIMTGLRNPLVFHELSLCSHTPGLQSLNFLYTLTGYVISSTFFFFKLVGG